MDGMDRMDENDDMYGIEDMDMNEDIEYPPYILKYMMQKGSKYRLFSLILNKIVVIDKNNKHKKESKNIKIKKNKIIINSSNKNADFINNLFNIIDLSELESHFKIEKIFYDLNVNLSESDYKFIKNINDFCFSILNSSDTEIKILSLIKKNIDCSIACAEDSICFLYIRLLRETNDLNNIGNKFYNLIKIWGKNINQINGAKSIREYYNKLKNLYFNLKVLMFGLNLLNNILVDISYINSINRFCDGVRIKKITLNDYYDNLQELNICKKTFNIHKYYTFLKRSSLYRMSYTIREFIDSKMCESLKLLFPPLITKFVGSYKLNHLVVNNDFYVVKTSNYNVRKYSLENVFKFVQTLYYLSNNLVDSLYDKNKGHNSYMYNLILILEKKKIPTCVIRYIFDLIIVDIECLFLHEIFNSF